MDTNGDGAISRDEWRGPAQFFDRMDQDGDGVISAKEIEGMSSRAGRGQEQAGQRPGGRSGLQPDAMDSDKDGKISEKELGEWFEKSDKNGDGFVDKDEWAAASTGRALRDPAPKVGDAAPKVSAKSLVGMDTVDLAQMTRLTVLIFGSHT
jgi:Ca2+-binding EF-hand superfamily protein